MNFREITSAVMGLNLCGVSLALRGSRWFRPYLSETLRRYDEYAGLGLPEGDPFKHLAAHGWGAPAIEDRVQLPSRILDGGGTSLTELTILAAATRVLRPKKVFEIGTFNGRTTTAFLLNTPPDARVFSLDLPPEGIGDSGMIDSDMGLVQRRKLASYVHELRLTDRFEQILCDSMKFDPEPHRDSVELSFIDGAHAYEFVRSDTEKMAVMMAPRGLVFWHDYGGKGRFRPLSEYLESLTAKFPVHRIPGTTLAWASADDVRKLRST